jgi:hypothetical protein
MKKASQSKLHEQLMQTINLSERRDLALELLSMTMSRQYIDVALRILQEEEVSEILNSTHQPVLRAKVLYYFDRPDKDKAGLIREQIVRLLVDIGVPEDIDIYLKGVSTYESQPVTDVTQNLRAVSLAGLANEDEVLASVYAVKLLGENDTSQFNGEPSITAVTLLRRFNQPLPIFQFLLRQGKNFIERGLAEVVGKALESLGKDFPLHLYEELADDFLQNEVPVVVGGIINYIIENDVSELYSRMVQIIEEAEDNDLHKYGLIMMATSRNEDIINLIYVMAENSTMFNRANFIEALELVPADDKRDAVLGSLQ